MLEDAENNFDVMAFLRGKISDAAYGTTLISNDDLRRVYAEVSALKENTAEATT